MNRVCVIVADGGCARFFGAEPAQAPHVKTALVERAVLEKPALRHPGPDAPGRPPAETRARCAAGPVHPAGAQPQRHRLDLDRRFGREIARQIGEMTRGWKTGTVVLIAEPRLLGMMRAHVRAGLGSGITLKELARDYTGLSAVEIRDRLPAPRRAWARH